MTHIRRWLAVPLALTATLCAIPARASEIRDGAGMFSAGAIRQAEAVLARSSVPVVIETIPALDGRTIQAETLARAARERTARVYVLLSKRDTKLWFEEKDKRFTTAQSDAIINAFFGSFKRGDFDAGLAAGSQAIVSAVSTPARSGGGAAAPAPGRGVPQRNGGGGSGLSFFLTIGLIILAVVVGMKILGGLFGAGRGGNVARPGMGGGSGPGMGGGYGGGGGGGFFSSMLGGIGGAMAGNWLYDRMRGHDSPGAGYTGGDATGSQGVAPDEAGWGGGAGGDWGGGDTGGDAGGGGDWGGGGGGDWGGGGGDGGGGGGGDWG